MPFEDIETHTKTNAPPTAVVTYMREKRHADAKPGSGARKPPNLKMTLPTTICGTSKSETFVLQFGTGADVGKVRVVGSKDAKKGAKPAQMKHAFRFNFGFVPRLGDEIFDAERCPLVKIDNETFEITVPRGLLATPVEPEKPSKR